METEEEATMAHEQFILSEGVSYQSFGGEEDGVMLSMQSGYLYRCNSTAINMLDRLQNGATLGDLSSLLQVEFELAEYQARDDANQFLDNLLAEKLARRVAA
jgi:hypothetical protein